mgnify:FL=1
MRFLGVARALQDGLGPATVAHRFGVSRSVVDRAAETFGIDLTAARAAEAAEREAARAAKASAVEQARAAREVVRAKRLADAKAAADARVAAKIERDRMKAEQAAEREERKRKALERKLDLTLRKFGRETGASYETVRQMIAHTIAETSKDKE